LEFIDSQIDLFLNFQTLNEGDLIVGGPKEELTTGKLSFIVYKIDETLNIIDSNEFILPGSIVDFSIRDLKFSNDNMTFMVRLDNDTMLTSWNGIGLFVINQNLDSVNFTFNYDGTFSVFPHSLSEAYSNHWIVAASSWSFNTIDTNSGSIKYGFFNKDDLKPAFTRKINSFSFNNEASIIKYVDSTYILSGNYTNFENGQRDVAVFKISSDFEMIDSIIISSFTNSESFISHTAPQNLDWRFEDALYFGSAKNAPFEFFQDQNWIRVVKFDGNLNVIWEKFYGGDLNYFTYATRATIDGGCIVLASRYDYLSGSSLTNLGIYILKLGPDGIVTSVQPPNGFLVRDFLVYPNPGNNLQLETSVKNYMLQLYDTRGVLVYRSHIISGYSKHITNNLKTGLYLYRIVNEDRELLETGKWIKN